MTSRTNDVEWAAGVLQLVGHPIRLRVLNLLRHAGELCVGDLCEVLRLPQSTASRHLALLREGGLVAVRQVGLWVYYRCLEPASALHGALAEWSKAGLAGLRQAQDDVHRLEQQTRGLLHARPRPGCRLRPRSRPPLAPDHPPASAGPVGVARRARGAPP